jgi:hypothetical protein
MSLTLAGCVQVGPETLFPDRDGRGAAAPTAAIPPVGAAVPRNDAACALPELPPIPATVRIDIAPDHPPQADAGGKALVIGYGQARDAIRACKEGM